jgi:transposase
VSEPLSLQNNWNFEIPADIGLVGRQILKENDPYRLIGEGVNDFLKLKDFAFLYSPIGRGGICPIMLSLVTVFQFLENLPDREAARAVVVRLDWKFALHLPLADPGFHYSDLSNFRGRLLEHEAERMMFEKVLDWVRALGFLKKYGKQRTDSTRILGNVERLSRLELAWESLRLALRAIHAAAEGWYQEVIPATFHQAYSERQSDWRLSAEEAKSELYRAACDGYWLLDHLDDAPAEVSHLPEVVTFQTVWRQQFERGSGKVVVRQPTRGQGKDTIDTPHDPQAHWAEKRGKEWVGYKWHVTETAEEDEEQFITDIEVGASNEDDSECVDDLQERLIAQDLKPEEHFLDSGYISAPNLAHSEARKIKLLGPALPDNSKKPEGYKQRDFQIDFEAQQVICPQGRISRYWHERPVETGRVKVTVQFKDGCEGCPVHPLCAPGKSGRSLTISPYHAELTQRRAEQETETFKEKMKKRSAIEGTISEFTRKHGARRARYRGKTKVRLQVLFTGAAVNLKRLVRAQIARKQAVCQATLTC